MSKIHVIDGKQYVAVERLAEVGEKVIIVSDQMYHRLNIGSVYEFAGNGRANCRFIEEEDGSDRDYIVLEPIADTQHTVEFTTDDVKYAPEKILDLLANLARRVTSLESQLASTQENVVRQAEELANLRYLAECNEADIAMLDERTYPLTRDSVRVFLGGGTHCDK